jgi:hypothetical protein
VQGLVPNPPNQKVLPLRREIASVLNQTAIKGEISRGEISRLMGVSERLGRDILNSLLKEGLLLSDSLRGPVRLGFPAHAAGYLFPGLYPFEK